MQNFPKAIQHAMRDSGSDATCVPVQIDGAAWECAWFVHVAGPECKQDRRILKRATTPIPVILSPELIKHPKAAVVLFTLEVLTIPDDPLVYEVLLMPGKVDGHYECLKLLSGQENLQYFFGDSDYRIVHEQEQRISRAQSRELETLTREVFAHDSVLRMTGSYNADTAIAEIVSHYQLRQNVGRCPSRTEH